MSRSDESPRSLLVTGSRSIKDPRIVNRVLDALPFEEEEKDLVHK
jgi:hypothetical protein